MGKRASIGGYVSSLMAAMAGALLLTSVIYVPRAVALSGGVELRGWRTDRRVWSSAALGSLLLWLGGVVGGAFAEMESPEVAGSAAFILALISGIWWGTLYSASRKPLSRPEVAALSGSTLSTYTSQEPSESGPATGPADAVESPPSATGTPAPGWYPDPWSEGSVRRWNGLEWTMDTRRDAQQR
jgi:hypothetical protein